MATGNAVYETTFDQVKNRVYSKLAAAITSGATTLTVTLADAGLFPDIYPYHLTLEDEIVKVTNRVSNTLTIVRAQQDTSAATHANKTYVALNITAKSISDLNAAVNTIEQAIVDGFRNIKVLGAADYPIDMSGATVNSGGSEIRLSNNAVIQNTTNGTLKMMTTASGYVSISEGQIIAKCDYLDIDLDVALRFIGAGKNIDGNVVFRDNVTIGRSGAPVTNQIYGRVIIEPSTAVDYAIRINGTAILNSGEQAIYINTPNETTATNGIWITLGSTITSGDLTGIRSRVTGNAASSGANVRGAYLEAKGGAGKYAAMLEGALVHADYSAGSVTVSGDVRGLTVQISQGASLNAANLYGILVNIQTRSDETITTDDVGLLIRNEAVGGNGRTMDAAIKIAELNMGGGTNGFTDDIIFHKTSHIRDEAGYLTIYGTAGYVRIGDASTTSHSLASEDDLMVTGKLEVGGVSYLDANLTMTGHILFSSGSYDVGSTTYGVRVVYFQDMKCPVAAGSFQTKSENNSVFRMYGYDNDTGAVELLELRGAADPNINFIAGQITFSYSGIADFGGTYLSLTERAAPGAGAANTARIYALQGAGDAFTDLCAVFQDGTVDVFAQETTEPDSPIFQFPDNTPLELTMRKPDRKTIQFVATFPDGREFVMRELRYPTARWN